MTTGISGKGVLRMSKTLLVIGTLIGAAVKIGRLFK